MFVPPCPRSNPEQPTMPRSLLSTRGLQPAFRGRVTWKLGLYWLFGSWLQAPLLAVQPPRVVPASNLIIQENLKPGATDWQLTRVRADGKGFRSPWIEGYCSKQSVRAGESVDVMVSTDPSR